MNYFFRHILLLFSAVGLLSLTFFISSCSTSTPAVNSQNLSYLYKDQQHILHPQYLVFHRTNTISELHFKINSNELLYSKQTGSETFSARISIHYRLISSYETKDIIDSATVVLTDVFSNSSKDIIGKMDFNATFTNTYLLQIDLTDQNRNVVSKSFININKLDHTARQNFILLSTENKIPLFKYTIGNKKFLIRHRTPGAKFFVRYYRREFPLPAPPFAISNTTPFEYRADSLYAFQLNENDTGGYAFGKPGFYHLQVDTNTTEGITLFRFNDHFPYMKKQEDLLEPLRYLTTKQEFDVLKSYKTPKTAVDSFWVHAGGSHDRGRELVKKFYNRVEDSNEYFSSYVEGWKTDRGLVYIIYGPPSIVYKSSDSENWVYGEKNNFNSLTFSFLKVINPFTDNDYRLDRSQVFKTSWFNAVEMWRQGKVYSEK